LLAWVLVLGCALASPLEALVEAVGGTPVVVMQCDRAGRVVGSMRAGRGLGLDLLDSLSDGASVFDLDAPIRLAILEEEGETRLAIEAAVRDVEVVSERLAATGDEAPFGETVSVDLSDGGIRIVHHQEGVLGPVVSLPLVARVDARAEEPGCTLAASVPALLAGAPASVPLLSQGTVLWVDFEETDGVHHAVLETAGWIPEPLTAVLDGEGSAGLAGVYSTDHLPLAIQAHGELEELLWALAFLLPPDEALMVMSLARELPARVKGERGVAVGIGEPEVGGALVVPMARPKRAGRLLRLTRALAQGVGATAEKVDRRVWRIRVSDRDPLTVGFGKGLIVVALREAVVRDVLAERGDPWFPPATGPYGVRLRADAGALPMFPGVDGYMEARYAEGALEVTVWPEGGDR